MHSWWNGNYRYRVRLTVNAGSVAVPNPFYTQLNFNLSVLTGKRVDNADVRIVRWNGTGYDEKNRVIYDDNNVFFAIDNEIAASGVDDNYYIYWGYAGASSPPAERRSIFVPRLRSDTLALYYFDDNYYDYASGQLSVAANLNNNGVQVIDTVYGHKMAYGDGSTQTRLDYFNTDRGYAWGTMTHPMRNISFYAQPTGTHNHSHIISYWRGGLDSACRWFIKQINDSGDCQVGWIRHNDYSAGIQSVTITGLFQSGWNHYAFAWSNTFTLRVYRNNAEVFNTPTNGWPRGVSNDESIQANANSAPSMFGLFNGSNYGNPWSGYLAGVRLGRNTVEEGIDNSFGARSSMPTVSSGEVQQPGGHCGAV